MGSTAQEEWHVELFTREYETETIRLIDGSFDDGGSFVGRGIDGSGQEREIVIRLSEGRTSP